MNYGNNKPCNAVNRRIQPRSSEFLSTQLQTNELLKAMLGIAIPITA